MTTAQWMIDVLEDLTEAAIRNDLADVAQALDEALRLAHAELGEQPQYPS